MPFPDVRPTRTPVADATSPAVLLVIPAGITADDLGAMPDLAVALDGIGFTGSAGTLARVHVPEVTSGALAVVGLGSTVSPDSVRAAVGAGIRQLTGFATITLAAPTLSADLLPAIAEGAGLGGYWFDDYKSKPGPRRAETVEIVTDREDAEEVCRAAMVRAGAVALVKDLVNIPADRLGPADLADRANTDVADLSIDVNVWDEGALEEGGFGGILGVGRGSTRPPRMVRLDYRHPDATAHIALVGKGITFDTGGLSLKPAASMVGMKYDMCGAAATLAVVRAVAQAQLPVHLTGWMCVADNMPSGDATRPGDVLTISNGLTVEVTNTDAEGRLVLADGLSAASAEHPDLIIDIATLTGAVSVALGTRHTGVMGDDEAVAQYLRAAREVGESAWQLPLPEYLEEELVSPIADLQNAKIGERAAGTLFAGLFLRRFVGARSEDDDAARIPWVHLDIAGVGMNKSAPFGFTDKGPTGAAVRSLIRLIENVAANE